MVYQAEDTRLERTVALKFFGFTLGFRRGDAKTHSCGKCSQNSSESLDSIALSS